MAEQVNPRPVGQDVDTGAANRISWYILAWVFVIGSVFGVVLETIWYFIIYHGFYNRQGLLYGPFSPIYGGGAVLVTLCLYKVRDSNKLVTFFVSAVLGGAFEYFCSYMQEVVFGTYSWNYAHQKYSIGGRTSLWFALGWGVLGTVYIRYAYPWICRTLRRLPLRGGRLAIQILIWMMAADAVLSIMAVKRQSERRDGIERTDIFSVYLDEKYPDDLLDSIFTKVKVVEEEKPPKPEEIDQYMPPKHPPAPEPGKKH